MRTKRTGKLRLKGSDLNPPVRMEIKELKQKESASRHPVTNERLAVIWPAWRAFPAEFDPTERDAILTGNQLHFGDYQQHYARLRRQFKKLLPLDQAEYHEALNAVSDWWRLMFAARTCCGVNKDEIEKQLRYESFDKQLIGFMASYRMHKEFAVMRPDLLIKDKCPTLEDLSFVRSRHAAYVRGRRDAVEILSGLIFSKALLAEYNSRYEDKISDRAQLAFPRHLLVARLKAFGKCSPGLLAHFMQDDFFTKLSPRGRLAFCKEYDHPSVGRENYNYLRLWAWLAENAPVFHLIKAGWPDIFDAVEARFKPGAPFGCRSHPGDCESLKIQWRDFTSKHGLGDPPRISPPIGKPRKHRLAIPSELLTPVPDFSTAE